MCHTMQIEDLAPENKPAILAKADENNSTINPPFLIIMKTCYSFHNF